MTFKGFEKPEQNYSKLPHSFIDVLPQIDTMAEMKVVLYLLRHTWGFSEFGKPKKLTTDEFCNGRKKKDQSRMDNGTGLSENSVRSGLEKAIEHGFILVETDETDKARIEKWYCLNMEDTSEFEPRGAKFEGLGAEFEERSEKETKERKEHTQSFPKSSKEELAGTSFEAAIFGLEPITQEQFNRENNRNVAPRMFEKALGFSKALPWWSNKEWSEFADWVVAEYARSKTSFGEYNTWRNEKFTKGGIANTRLRGFPSEFFDSWDMFLMATNRVGKVAQVEPKTYNPADEEELEFVPAPPRRK